jgi:nitrite reductase (NADH) large subunit
MPQKMLELATGATETASKTPLAETEAPPTEDTAAAAAPDGRLPVIVVGAGPVGMRVAEALLSRDPDCPVKLFGDERWEPYNRVLLTPLMVGEIPLADIYYKAGEGFDGAGQQLLTRHIVAIAPDAKTVTDESGAVHAYDKLVLATGSRPHIPNIPNIDLGGVFTFRDLNDVEALLARSVRSRSAVVIGGGLLGLEAARGLHRRGIKTTVIEHERRLMFRQLDQGAGALLADHMSGIGIDIRTGVSIRSIVSDTGEGVVTGVSLSDGSVLDCDTVVVCTGIRPNMEIARDAGIAVGQGIKVDNRMQTSAEDIFAVGECAEHDGRVYGLMAPGLEQAAVAAHHILGGKANYAGSVAATKLKVVGIPVFSIGAQELIEVEAAYKSIAYAPPDKDVYRRLTFHRGRLVGVIAIGEWPDLNKVQEAATRQRLIMPWQRRRFLKSGSLWKEGVADDVARWPATATVCNCTGVCRGELSDAMSAGARSVEALKTITGASTVCGSCGPLLAELIGSDAKAEPAKGAKLLTGLSVAALILAALMALIVPLPHRDSVEPVFQLDILWTDSLYKQVSGFTLLGLAVLAALLSLRKRIRWLSFGDFGIWRILHVALGVGILFVLFVHTGFHLGHNLNQALMLTFLLVTGFGAVTGAAVALEHKLSRQTGGSARKISTWTHILLCWPLPLLLGLHILTVYFY